MKFTIYSPPDCWLIRAEMKIGKPQRYIKKAKIDHLRKFLEENNAPSHNAEMGIMSYQFTERGWNNKKNGYEEGWLDWMRKQRLQKQVEFKLIGGPKIRAESELSDLLYDDIIKEIAIPPKHETFHIIYCTNPKLLWIEQYHKNRNAKRVYSTNNPFEVAWEELYGVFNELYKICDKKKGFPFYT